MKPSTLVVWLLIFAGFYYLYTFIGFVTGFLDYGGPANQTMALILAVASVIIVHRLKALRLP